MTVSQAEEVAEMLAALIDAVGDRDFQQTIAEVEHPHPAAASPLA